MVHFCGSLVTWGLLLSGNNLSMWLTFSGNGLKFWAQVLTPRSFHVLTMIQLHIHLIVRKIFWSCSPSEAVALVEGGGANIFWWKCHKETSSSMSGRVRMLNFSFRSLFLVSKKD